MICFYVFRLCARHMSRTVARHILRSLAPAAHTARIASKGTGKTGRRSGQRSPAITDHGASRLTGASLMLLSLALPSRALPSSALPLRRHLSRHPAPRAAVSCADVPGNEVPYPPCYSVVRDRGARDGGAVHRQGRKVAARARARRRCNGSAEDGSVRDGSARDSSARDSSIREAPVSREAP